MKGQFNVEYLFSLIVFILVLLYLSAQISNVVPQYHQKSIENRLYNDAFRASEILIKDSNNGLVFSPYNFSATKLMNFKNRCNNDYENLKKDIGLEDRDFQINIYVNSSLNYVCGMGHIPEGVASATLNRYGVTNGEITKVKLMVW